MAKTIVTTAVLKVNGKEVENSFTKVNGAVRKLSSDLRKLEVGTEDWIKKAAELKEAKAHFEKIKAEINAATSAMDKSSGIVGFFKKNLLSLGDTFRQVFTANLAERFLDTIFTKSRQTADELLKVADAMTDVQKTSGMSLEQVKNLWDAFDEMDTRTNKMDRLKIAEVGGRLGVPIEEMKSFVQEVDKAYVALGDSFEGGLEGVVDQLGKIKGLFEETKGMTYAESINRVGSALNTLAAQGTASEGNISQFALRVGALPDALKPSIDKVLGLGAAFEESGIDAQIASSGFSNFITTAAENIEGFAYSMNMSVAQAKELINTKPEEFFLRFAEGMKGIPAAETAKIFASLKLNSLEVQKAVGAAANKTDEFRKAMTTAGVEMDKMSSLQDEFNQKNNNAPAIIEKIKNAWNDIFTSTNVINQFEWLIQLIGWLTGVTSTASNGIIEFKERLVFLWQIIKVITGGLLGYQSGLLITSVLTSQLTKNTLLATVAEKAKAISTYAANVVLLLYNFTLGLVTFNLDRCRKAMIVFNLATKANPIGLLIGLLMAAVVAYQYFSKELDASTKKQRMLNDVQRESEKNIVSQKNELKLLLKTAKDEHQSKERRLEAIKKLNEISPEYLGNLRLENINTQEAANAVKAYSEELLRNSKLKVLNKKLDEVNEKIIDKQKEPVKNNGNWVDKNLPFLSASELKKLDENQFKQYDKWLKKGGLEYAKLMMDTYGYVYENKNQSLQGLKNEAQEITDEIIALQGKIKNPDEIVKPTNVAAPDKANKNRKAENTAKVAADDLEKSKEAYNKSLEAKTEADKKMLELQRAYEDEKNKIIEGSRKKAIDDENTDFNRKKEDLVQQNVEIKNQITKSNTEIQKLQRDKNETKSPEAAKNFEAAIAKLKEANTTKENLISKNNKIIEQMEQTHQFNLKKIKEVWDLKDFEDGVRQNQLDTDQKKRELQDELTSIKDLESAKNLIRKKMSDEYSENEIKNIKTLSDAKKILEEKANQEILKIQLDFLTEQKKKLDEIVSQLDPNSPEGKALIDRLSQFSDKISELMSGIKNPKKKGEKSVEEIAADEQSAKENTDILGFSAADWEKSFENLDTTEGKLKAVGMAFQALANAGQMFSQLQQAQNERELRQFNKIQDAKKKSLLKNLNEGYITREEYVKETEKLEAEAANKKAEMEYKQAKAEKISRIFSVIGATAQAVATALKAGPIYASIVGALGAVQLGIVASQPLPEKPKFADGGFTGSGFGSADSTGYKPAGIVHENEWVAPEWMLEEPRTAKVIDYLESVRVGKTKPMADGGFSADNTTTSVASKKAETDNTGEYYAIMSDVRDFLKKLYDEGVIAILGDDLKNIRRMAKKLKELEQLENKNKH